MNAIPPRVASAWAVIRRRTSGSSEFDLLSRTFFARFFDNEISGGSSDLRTSFFWLLAFLAAPGMAIPMLMSFGWDIYAIVNGTDALRVAARGDKAFYLGLAMVSSGLVSTIVWNSLLLDRRDCLVLGVLPVSGPRLVRAKLTALCTYILLVAIGMHTVASIMYGFFLAAHASLAVAWAGIAAHMVASCAASAFVLFAVAATQGLLLAVAGPRRFAVLSPWLQSGVVAFILLSLLTLPLIDSDTVETLAGRGDAAHIQPWLLYTPPLWFLGLYESVMRTNDPVLLHLRNIAILSLAGAATVTLLSYPIAYRRLASSVVQMQAPTSRFGWPGRIIEWAVASISRRPETRASSQFFLTTVRRSVQQRFAMALAAGTTVAFICPAVFRLASHFAERPAHPRVDLLALPFGAMSFLLIGLRIAAALPADLNASWLIDSIGAAPGRLRSGLWRTMFVVAVLPVSIVTTASCGYAWGATVATVHGLTCLVFGGVAIEALLWGYDAMPCSRAWRPEHANLRTWWPAYLALFLFVTGGLPTLETISFDHSDRIAALIGGLVFVGVAVRTSHRRRRIMPDEDFDELAHVQVLNLD